MVLPPKFKVPDFKKYDGTICPKAHLVMFCRKMTGYVNADKLLIHCFQDSLVGFALRWYNQLSRERIRSWKDLASAFCEQYKHVSDMVPDRLTLQIMEKKPTETFRKYAQRWRDISAQVELPLTKTEITVLFINTLKAPFYDKLVGSATKDFTDIVISGEVIENAIKSGRMEGFESSERAAHVKKKEAEAYMVGTENYYTSNPYPTQSRPRYRPPPNFYYPPQSLYYQTPPHYPSHSVYATNNQRPVTTFPQNTMPAQSQPKDEQRQTRSNPEKPQFTPIPVSYGELRVQGLIDAGILRFDDTSNTTGNLLPNHTKGNVSAVTKEEKWRTKSCVSEIKTPLQKIWRVMVEKGLFCRPYRFFKEGSIKGQCFYDFHDIEGHDIQSCKEFRKLLQDMMDNKEIGIFNKEVDERDCYYDTKKEQMKPKMIIEVPSLFPYKDNKAIPWKYDVNIIIPEGEKSKIMTENVGEVGHFTCSERCYSKAVELMKKTNDLKQKGKAPMQEAEVELETPSEQKIKRSVNEKEVHEFLKFIKHSEYNVVEQLSKQLARISVLSLLLNSEPHRNALLKVLNQAYVASNIFIEKLDSLSEEDIVASIFADAPYLEVSKDAVKCFFRSLEFINATFVVEGNRIPMPKLSRNTKMGIKLTVGKGARAGKGSARDS
ncbi:uncharacterized protein [Gossypium hirsutum]|uniref:Retrotransposon gag domain-containing protein n=1 Tax=Gossypium hirsutum TaxID=3635 RepID=A0ABM2ZC49_GOSHI|nr:uncharacterized protein LOC107952320 [Gossypium hirsutum]